MLVPVKEINFTLTLTATTYHINHKKLSATDCPKLIIIMKKKRNYEKFDMTMLVAKAQVYN